MIQVDVKGVARRFGRTIALADATLSLRSAEIVALLGPNGAGKTTLLECIAGLQVMDAGSVRCNGSPMSATERAATVLYLPDGITPWSAQSANWLVRFAGTTFGHDSTVARDVLDTMRIADFGAQPIGTLSKGQRKRLLLAITLVSSRPIILLDEPFDGLDLRMTRATIALLKRLAGGGRGFLLSIHAMADAERVADRLVLLSDGRTIGDGTLDALRTRIEQPDASLEEVFLALS